jgi:hypothetical protein
MDKLTFATLMRRELRAVLRLTPWVLISLLLAAILWRTDLAAVSGLFQSPPTATVTSEPPTATPTEEPTETPTVELPTDTPPPTATLEPTAPPVSTSVPTALPTATLEPSPVPAETTSTPTPTATVEAGAEDSRYTPEGDLAFDWGMFFDSVALGVSYLWLCCGILLLFAVPVAFAVLWVASKRREEQEE